MKKDPPSDPEAELIKDYLADNPEVILELLPDDVFPNGSREGVSIKVMRVDLEEDNRTMRSLPYQPGDPLLRFIKEQPELLLKFLRDELGLKLPAYEAVKIEEQDLDHIVPQAPTHTVLLCQREGVTVYGIALDILRQIEQEKTYHWPLNTAVLHGRIKTRTTLVVLAAGAEIEQWALTPNYWQGPKNPPFLPVVIGPGRFIAGGTRDVAADPARAALAALLGPLKACA